MDSIITKINENANSILEPDLDNWLVPELLKHYQSRLDKHVYRAYGASGGASLVARRAFCEQAKATLRSGLSTFLFKSQLWKNGRDINTYLLACLRRLSDKIYWDQCATKRSAVLICPACRELGVRVILVLESKMWKCSNCASEMDRLQDDVKKGKLEDGRIRSRIRMHKTFWLHSRRGYRCPEPDCSRFIPESANGKFGIECPYYDCSFFGDSKELEIMSHPSSVAQKDMLSLDRSIGENSDNISFKDVLKSDNLPVLAELLIKETYNKEYNTLISVIDTQMARVRRMNNYGTRVQKLLMYDAFKFMCQKSPEEMVSYLVHLRQTAEIPLQVRIFQEYIRLIEESLPFMVKKHGQEEEIFSISDPLLGLFVGLSVFDAVVDSDGRIPNDTIETYAGSRMFKQYGSYFIGKLLDVVDLQSNQSVLNCVISNTFVDITTSLLPGTKVKVTHYRIPPHYEMGNMVLLQRIRKQIVNSVYFLLNGEKRKIGRKSDDIAVSA